MIGAASRGFTALVGIAVGFLVAGHPAADATVPTAALSNKPLDAIAAWV